MHDENDDFRFTEYHILSFIKENIDVQKKMIMEFSPTCQLSLNGKKNVILSLPCSLP